jgi:quinol monooxygenase YgiN
MRSASVALFVLGLGSSVSTPTVAQETNVQVATYVDAVPQSAQAVSAMFEGEAAASRKDDGCGGAQALREIGQDNRFLLIETWKDQGSFEAHGKSSHATQFRNRLDAIELASPDERILAAIWQGQASKTPATANAVWVVTHVDAMPQYMDEASSMLERLAEGSVKQAGNLRFLVTHQPDLPNHFTVMENWADRASFEAHQAADATKQFREKLGPMLGALYDQRIYRAID